MPQTGNLAVANLGVSSGGVCTDAGVRGIYHFKPVDKGLFTKMVRNTDCSIDVYIRDDATSVVVGYINVIHRFDHNSPNFGPGDYEAGGNVWWSISSTCPAGSASPWGSNPAAVWQTTGNYCSGEWRYVTQSVRDQSSNPIFMNTTMAASLSAHAACWDDPVEGVWQPVTANGILETRFCAFLPVNVDSDNHELTVQCPWTQLPKTSFLAKFMNSTFLEGNVHSGNAATHSDIVLAELGADHCGCRPNGPMIVENRTVTRPAGSGPPILSSFPSLRRSRSQVSERYK